MTGLPGLRGHPQGGGKTQAQSGDVRPEVMPLGGSDITVSLSPFSLRDPTSISRLHKARALGPCLRTLRAQATQQVTPWGWPVANFSFFQSFQLSECLEWGPNTSACGVSGR